MTVRAASLLQVPARQLITLALDQRGRAAGTTSTLPLDVGAIADVDMVQPHVPGQLASRQQRSQRRRRPVAQMVIILLKSSRFFVFVALMPSSA